MRMTGIPFGTTNWAQIDPTEHPRETDTAFCFSVATLPRVFMSIS